MQDFARLLYALKRRWGTVFDYIQIETSEADNRTGSRTIKRQVLHLPAVLLPQSQIRKFIQDIGYLAADKNFTYGALNDYNSMSFLLDYSDLPKGFKPELNGYTNWHGKKYERVRLDDLGGQALLLTVQGVEGALPYARIDEGTHNALAIQGRVSYELN